jgi:hypothetical protein
VGLFTADPRLTGARLQEEMGIRLKFPSFRSDLQATLADEASARDDPSFKAK